ncbi:hypothetical protein COCOR_06989 [Corallococcus coralloides DSM 2259]|uniref:Transcription elongation factor GreA/GreB C-terminal domain-containing protein n=1 Tax=Corallococcus coralloides (strain ATCC 25202 / DSM 2259 / NBRC 100086 / M2) TaxID=1144275 RepID=H8MFQ9_CORCM|nr:GreA/GreB family elongation factor [Corallococcus coralloides]AFE07262.1 hypothetical protein COCOR_06989 [Corallococcus coralloides DSM 2259]
MPKDESSPQSLETPSATPSVHQLTAQTAIVAGSIGHVNITISGASGNLHEILRLATATEQPSHTAPPEDPLAAEISAYANLIDQNLVHEALKAFRDLYQKHASKPGHTRSYFRIKNNIGVCLIHLGQFTEAQAELKQALSFDPNNELAKLNLASACLYADEPEAALNLLPANVSNTSIRGSHGALRIAALYRLNRHSEIDEFLRFEPWAAYDAHVQLAALPFLFGTGDQARIDEAIKTTTGNEETALNAFVMAGMRDLGVTEKIGTNLNFVPINQDHPRTRIEQALASFTRALELSQTSPPEIRAEVYANRGLALSLLGRTKEAADMFEAGLAINARATPSATLNYASTLMGLKDYSSAARVIKNSGFAGEQPKLRLQLATALFHAGAFPDIVDLLDNTWQTFDNRDDRINGATLLLGAYDALQNISLGEALVETLSNQYADSWEAWLHIGQHFDNRKDKHKALLAFQRCLTLAPEVNATQVREELAHRQAVWHDYTGCITTLAPLDTKSLSNKAAHALAVSLYNTGALNQARPIVDFLLNKNSSSIHFLELGVAITSAAGDLGRAIHLQQALCQSRPSELRDFNLLAELMLRNGEHARAAVTLNIDPFELAEGQDPHDLMVFAYLLSTVKDKRALSYGYRAWERGRDQAQILLGYIGLFLHRRAEANEDLEPQVVSPGTTVTLSTSGKTSLRDISIVRENDLIPDTATWIRATDPLAARLLGKRVGDEVPGHTSPWGKVSYRIKKIQSTFVRAFQETMSGFNDRFPDAEGLWKFDVSDNDPLGLTKLILTAIGKSGQIKPLIEMHMEGRMPLAAFAHAIRRPIPVAWLALSHDKQAGLFFSRGATQQLHVAEQVLSDRERPRFLDYSALMTLTLLDEALRTKVVQLLGPVLITQSLLDDLYTHTSQAIHAGTREGFTVSLGDDGRLKGAPLFDTSELLEQTTKLARAIATPCATYSQFNSPPAARDVASKVLGRATSDLLWEAEATSGFIICDDQALNSLAQNENKTQCTSVQAIALAAHKQGRLSASDYSSLVAHLAMARYRIVELDIHIVNSILEKHLWQPTAEVLAIFSCLSDPSIPTQRAGLMGADVLKSIVLEPASALSRNRLIDALLAQLTAHHNAADMAATITSKLRVSLRLAPLQFNWLKNTIDAWLTVRT